MRNESENLNAVLYCATIYIYIYFWMIPKFCLLLYTIFCTVLTVSVGESAQNLEVRKVLIVIMIPKALTSHRFENLSISRNTGKSKSCSTLIVHYNEH